MKNDITLLVKIENVTMAQAVALKTMFEDMEYLGKVGGSRYLAFMSDGDGNFRPKITVASASGSKPIRVFSRDVYAPLTKPERKIYAHIYDQQHLARLLE